MIVPLKNNYRRFPVMKQDFKSAVTACMNIYKKIKSTELTYDREDEKSRVTYKFTPEMSPFPSELNFTAYQIPKGTAVGIRFEVNAGDKDSLTFLNDRGEVTKFNVTEKKKRLIFEIISGINKNIKYLEGDDMENSAVTLWFINAGDQSNKVYGCDRLPNFMLLIAVNWNGLWIRPEDFRRPDMDEAIRKEIYDSKFMYLSDFKSIKINSKDTKTEELLSEFLEKDEIRDSLANITGKTKDTAYASLIVPEFSLFYQRPSTWAMVKYIDL